MPRPIEIVGGGPAAVRVTVTAPAAALKVWASLPATATVPANVSVTAGVVVVTGKLGAVPDPPEHAEAETRAAASRTPIAGFMSGPF
jgi:hypothetical protein